MNLRRAVARGTIVNAAFLMTVNLLVVARGFVIAALLTRAEYGVWGILAVLLNTLLWFRRAGLGEKFVQQDSPDEELELQRMVTLELALAMLFGLVGCAVVPLMAAGYDTPEVVAPGLLLVSAMPALALQAMANLFYRRLDFVRQRRLQAVDPLVTFVVSVVLAALGAGYWSLVIGTVAGAWVGALVIVATSPIRLRLRFSRETLRSYTRFSWPLLVLGASGIVIAQVTVGVGEAELGLAGVGAIWLAANISQIARRADDVVSTTLYPAIAAVKERAELLAESFVKSNRLALMWGIPFGVALALFAPDLVAFVLGEEWRPAVILMQLVSLTVGLQQVGFNWDSFYRALDRTAPVAVYAVVSVVTYLAIPVPLLITEGLRGFAWGFLAVEAVMMTLRAYYLRRLFEDFRLLGHLLRAVLPVVPAVAAALALRILWPGEREAWQALVEVAVFVALVGAVTYRVERSLIREVLGYLRGRGAGG
jgi:O-antigen/teichoic acid export membrane protein